MKLLNFSEGKHPAEIVPEHKILQANPTVRGDFLEKIRVGVIKPHRAGVSKITEHGLVTTKGEEIEADVIISCTGYLIEYPYLPEDSYRAKDGQFRNTLDLYELVLSVNYRNLFFMGILELPGPLPPCVEAQARWATGILTSRIPLPSPAAMRESIAEFRAWQAKNWVSSNRHTVSIHQIPYCDRLLQHLDANPTFTRLFALIFSSGHPFRALKMLSAVYMDIPSASQYRLFGHGKCVDLATESVLRIARGDEKCSQAELKALNELATKDD
jgi:dimethylaniline monooxygenase (N-oxide forming)